MRRSWIPNMSRRTQEDLLTDTIRARGRARVVGRLKGQDSMAWTANKTGEIKRGEEGLGKDPQFSLCVLVAQSCPTLCEPMDCSPPGTSVHVHVKSEMPVSLRKKLGLFRSWHM